MSAEGKVRDAIVPESEPNTAIRGALLPIVDADPCHLQIVRQTAEAPVPPAAPPTGGSPAGDSAPRTIVRFILCYADGLNSFGGLERIAQLQQCQIVIETPAIVLRVINYFTDFEQESSSIIIAGTGAHAYFN